MSYIHVSSYVTEALMWVLIGFFSFGVVLLFVFMLLGLVEEWSYAKKQSEPDHPIDADPTDTVASGVVLPRARHRSILPRMK